MLNTFAVIHKNYKTGKLGESTAEITTEIDCDCTFYLLIMTDIQQGRFR